MTFEYEYVPDLVILSKQISDCEGRHTQQAMYSTFHGALTQICYGCLKVRSQIRRPEVPSEHSDSKRANPSQEEQ